MGRKEDGCRLVVSWRRLGRAGKRVRLCCAEWQADRVQHCHLFGILTLAPLLLDANQQECKKLLRAIHEIPCVKSKADWALRWISHSSSFAERLVAFACVEGIHFSGR